MPKKKTQDEFVSEVYELVGDEYTVLGEYMNAKTNIKMKHHICGNEIYLLPTNFLKGVRCKHCHYKKLSVLKSKTNEQFISEIFNLVGNEYTILEKYKSDGVKIKVRHNVCGNEYDVTPQKILHGRRCPECANKRLSELFRKTTNQYKKEVFESVGDEYIVLGEYINAKTKITIKHNECGLEWDTIPYNITSGHGCPNCNGSKGEKHILEWLIHNNISDYKKEYKINNNATIGKKRFDYALYNDKEILYIIEYDGKHHFEPIEYWGGQENLEFTQHNDKIKNQYCIDNNIPLIRIPYWEFDNIENILDNIILGVDNGVDGDSFLVQ